MVLATDLKQWAYCPRVVYYQKLMPGSGLATYKMRTGASIQEQIEKLELRRTLARYGFENAERRFGLWLASESLGLSGKIDLLVVAGATAAAVDFKLTSGDPGDNHRLQLAGYALLVEAELGFDVLRCFLSRIPDDRVFEIPTGPAEKDRARTAIAAIQDLQASEFLPDPTTVRARCTDCEYANYCADVW